MRGVLQPREGLPLNPTLKVPSIHARASSSLRMKTALRRNRPRHRLVYCRHAESAPSDSKTCRRDFHFHVSASGSGRSFLPPILAALRFLPLAVSIYSPPSSPPVIAIPGTNTPQLQPPAPSSVPTLRFVWLAKPDPLIWIRNSRKAMSPNSSPFLRSGEPEPWQPPRHSSAQRRPACFSPSRSLRLFFAKISNRSRRLLRGPLFRHRVRGQPIWA